VTTVISIPTIRSKDAQKAAVIFPPVTGKVSSSPVGASQSPITNTPNVWKISPAIRVKVCSPNSAHGGTENCPTKDPSASVVNEPNNVGEENRTTSPRVPASNPVADTPIAPPRLTAIASSTITAGSPSLVSPANNTETPCEANNTVFSTGIGTCLTPSRGFTISPFQTAPLAVFVNDTAGVEPRGISEVIAAKISAARV
jgi:hypothetical protein